MAPCPGNWDYEDFPGHEGVLLTHVGPIVKAIWTPGFKTLDRLRDSRRTHRALFSGLTPPLNPDYAGNYRGSSVDPCLAIYEVGIDGDSRVGSAAAKVDGDMVVLGSTIEKYVLALDANRDKLSIDQLVNYLVIAGSAILEHFFRIHPYANGNGHLGRFILTAFLARYGFAFSDALPIEPKPADRQRYSDCISLYRDGNKDPLHAYIAECIDLASPALSPKNAGETN